MYLSGSAGHIYTWLATVHQEKMARLLGVNRYNPGYKQTGSSSLDGRVPKLAVLYLPAYFPFLELYPFTPSKGRLFTGER